MSTRSSQKDLRSETSVIRVWNFTQVVELRESRVPGFELLDPFPDKYRKATERMWNFLSIHIHARNPLSNLQSTMSHYNSWYLTVDTAPFYSFLIEVN